MMAQEWVETFLVCVNYDYQLGLCMELSYNVEFFNIELCNNLELSKEFDLRKKS